MDVPLVWQRGTTERSCMSWQMRVTQEEAAVASDAWCVARRSCVRTCRASQTPERSEISSQDVPELVGHVPILMQSTKNNGFS